MFMEDSFYSNMILTPSLDFKGRKPTEMEFPKEEAGMRFWHFQGCPAGVREAGGAA